MGDLQRGQQFDYTEGYRSYEVINTTGKAYGHDDMYHTNVNK